MNLLLLLVAGVLVGLLIAVLFLSRRSVFARFITSLFALGFAAFCGYGYLASFELPASSSWPWQLGYAILGIGFLVAATLGLKSCFTRHQSTAGRD